MRCDHEIKFLADAELYLSLKHLAEIDDRTLSDYLRHMARCHVREKVSGMDRRLSSDRQEPGDFGQNREDT